MKITDISTTQFCYSTTVVRDSAGHAHPGEAHDATQTLLCIRTDEGAEGYSFGGNPGAIDGIVKPALLGEDPLFRERIWQDLKE